MALFRLLAGVALALGLSPLSSAQDNQVVALPSPAKATAGNPSAGTVPTFRGLLWKVTSATTTVYLAGSPRFGSADMYPLPEETESVFQRSSVLFVEVDPRGRGPRKRVQELLTTAGTYPAGDTLWNHVSERTRSSLPTVASEYGLDVQALPQMKPWAVQLMLAAPVMQELGMRRELGIDVHFLGQAGAGKRVDQLETVDQQVRALIQAPEREHARALELLVTGLERSKKDLAEMKAAWLSGDAEAVEALASEEYRSGPELRRRLLDDRSARITAAVERYLKGSERCFVAVDPAYLVGKGGTVSRLRAKGFRVEQVGPSSYREALSQSSDYTLPSGKRIRIVSIVRMRFERGDDALVLNCIADISTEDMVALRGEVDEIWGVFRADVEKAGMRNGVVRVAHSESGGVEKGYGFVFRKRADGEWHCLEDDKK